MTRIITRLKIVPPIVILMLLVAHFSYAQVPIQGQIKDETGAGLPGVSVVVKGSTAGTVTDSNGKFKLDISGPDAILVFTFIGYAPQEVKAGATTNFDITMQPDVQQLKEVVFIGYQSIDKELSTSSISSVKGTVIQNLPQPSFDQMLQGRLAGVSVISTTGELGAKPMITIRGNTNVDYGNSNGGNSGPLYVIDGVIFDVNAMETSYGNNNPLSFLNPNEIESIDVLKDASAAGIYGARGGNGVIVVKTKKGKAHKTQITASAYTGFVQAPNFRHVLTGKAERDLKLRLLYGGMSSSDITAGKIPVQLTDSLNSMFNGNVDWQGLMIRQRAKVNSQDVSFSGGNEAVTYRISANHYTEEGLINGYSLEKITPKINLGIHPLKNLTINTQLLLASETRKHGVGGSNGSLFNSWNFPTSLVKLSQEQIDVYSGRKSYYEDNKIFTIVGSVGLEYTITDGLVFNSNFAAENYTDKYAYFTPKEVNGVQNSAYDINSSNPTWTLDNYLSYTKKFDKHHFSVTAGTSDYSNRRYNSYAYANGVNVTGIGTIQTVPPGPNLSVNTSAERKTTVSYYGRLTYDFDSRYLLMASVRRDASSIYSPAYRAGIFSSVSGAWKISSERFFEPFKSVVNFFKVRGSWGVTGNDPGTWYAKYQPLYSDASYYASTTGTVQPNGTNPYLGGTPSTYNGTTVVSPYPYYNGASGAGVQSSSSVRWEKSPQTDIGVDFEVLNGRVRVESDWYLKNTNNKFFYSIPAQATSGYQYYSGNYVNIRNTGLEIAIFTTNLGPKSPVQWNTTFNIAFNQNMVTKLPNGNRDFVFGEVWAQKTLTLGQPLFNYRVWQTDGAFSTDEDVPVDPITGKKLSYFGAPLAAGDAHYKDMNGDYIINNDDKVNIGNPNPKYTGGFSNTFSYKGFSLTVFCSYLGGRKVFNGALSDLLNGSRSIDSWGTNAGPAALPDMLDQFWQEPGDHAKYPKLVNPSVNYAQDPWNIGNSYFVEDGSFLKIKNVTLGYDLPQTMLSKVKMSAVRFYVVADNVHTFKRSKSIADPELADPTSGSVNVIYPSALKITFGVNLSL
ncbi:MAG TPA: TonB-dependent receptor [Cyclobacteriaceae bacterium]